MKVAIAILILLAISVFVPIIPAVAYNPDCKTTTCKVSIRFVRLPMLLSHSR